MRIKHHRPRRRRRRSVHHVPLLKRLGWKKIVGLGFGAIFAFLLLYSTFVLPSVDNADQFMFSESTIIYDREAINPTENQNDHILYIIHGAENREFIPFEEISPWIKKATIAIEDDQFYSFFHFGFDIGGIIKAVLAEIGIGKRRGGSTITQQLVKNTFLSNERTYLRKFNEILLSIKVEMKYSKDEILEMYLNKIPYGHNAHGIEAAAKKFFGKSARDLTLAESAVLASLPAAPTRFSPFGSNKNLLMGYDDCSNVSAKEVEAKEANTEEVEKATEDQETEKPVSSALCEYKKGRKDLVLQRMLDTKVITFEEFKIAWSESKNLTFQENRTDIKAPHFVFLVRELLEQKYGKEFLREGGLRIYTTLDPNLQAIAEDTIAVKSAHYANTWQARNAALVSINPENGEILAYVGGKDYFDQANDGQVDVLRSRRQPGSSFKPLVYTLAFEKGYNPASRLFDVETDFGGNYQPHNYDGNFSGLVTAREALNRSLNIPAIKMAYLANPKHIIEASEALGIKIEGDAETHGVALGVGVAEVEPLGHINSFQIFVNNDHYYDPTAILEIRNSNGKVLEKFDAEKTKKAALDPYATALVRNILTDETTRPTTDDFDWNKLLQLEGFDNGAKTGTSNRNVKNPDFDEEKEEDEKENPRTISAPGDSWTIGFTPHLVTGVWVGNNKGEAMKPGATGLSVAAPIWRAFMADAHNILEEKAEDAETFKEKDYPEIELVTKKINKYTGRVATEVTKPEWAIDEVFAPDTVPIELDNFTDLKQEDQKALFHAIRSDLPNWQAPVTDWLEGKEGEAFWEMLGVESKPEYPEYADDFYTNGRPRFGANSPTRGSIGPSVQVISPQRNQRIPINSQFEAFVLPAPTAKISSVELQINGRKVNTLNRPPYSAMISTKNLQPAKGSFTVIITDSNGKIETLNVPVEWTREQIISNQTPLIGEVKKKSSSVSVKVSHGGRKKIDSIRLSARRNRQVLYERTIAQPNKLTLFEIPKTIRGPVVIELFTKENGKAEEITSTKTVQF